MKVLITGGGTRVMIDKVRCLGNIFRGSTAINIAYTFEDEGELSVPRSALSDELFRLVGGCS